MNTAVDLSPFISAVEPSNIIPFPKHPPPVPAVEVSLNEILLSFHAGTPLMAWIQPNTEGEANQHINWHCGVCGKKPGNSAALMSVASIMCQSCHGILNNLFTYTNKQ